MRTEHPKKKTPLSSLDNLLQKSVELKLCVTRWGSKPFDQSERDDSYS